MGLYDGITKFSISGLAQQNTGFSADCSFKASTRVLDGVLGTKPHKTP